jgi:hypothetical protein
VADAQGHLRIMMHMCGVRHEIYLELFAVLMLFSKTSHICSRVRIFLRREIVIELDFLFDFNMGIFFETQCFTTIPVNSSTPEHRVQYWKALPSQACRKI